MKSFPTVSQYIETLVNGRGLFRTLGVVEPLYNTYREPLFCAGNFSVLFRVRISGEEYALKCYTRPVERLDRIVCRLAASPLPYGGAVRYCPDEIYVYDLQGRGSYYPVVVQPWIEGETMGRYVDRLSRSADREGLERLSEKFDRLSLWLLQQEFAHGDIKPDNILIDRERNLRLIDWDGAFLPEFCGERASLIGSPLYRHPLHDELYFNKRIDDYPLALIAFGLYALKKDPSLYGRHGDREKLLFDAQEVVDGSSVLFARILREAEAKGDWAAWQLGETLRSPQPALEGLERIFRYRCAERSLTLFPGWELVDGGVRDAALIRWHGRYGYADLNRERLLVAPVWEEAHPLCDGRVGVVRQQGVWHSVSLDEMCQVSYPDYEEVSPFREGVARVVRGGRCGFINAEGREVIAPRYESASLFREGKARVRFAGRSFFVDTTGGEVLSSGCGVSRR